MEMRLVSEERSGCWGAVPSVGARPEAKRVGDGRRVCVMQCTAFLGYGRNAESCETDGRVKIGQSIAEMLLEGSEVPVLTLRFVSRGRAGECLRSAGIPNRDTPGIGLLFFFFSTLLALVLKKNQLKRASKQTKRITIEGLSLRPPFNASQDY